MNWQPIESAPKDGRPVWVRGMDFGKPEGLVHTAWATFDSTAGEWSSANKRTFATSGHSKYLKYLTHWAAPTELP